MGEIDIFVEDNALFSSAGYRNWIVKQMQTKN